MIWSRRCLMSVALFSIALPFCAYGADFQPAEVERLVRTPFVNLSIQDAYVSGEPRFWLTWETGNGGDREVHLTLLGLQKGSPAALWNQTWQESYQPTLTILSAWRYENGPVLALTYQQGAAAETVQLFGIGGNGIPVSLGSRDAAAIEFLAVGRGELVLIDEFGSTPATQCLSWTASGNIGSVAECPLTLSRDTKTRQRLPWLSLLPTLLPAVAAVTVVTFAGMAVAASRRHAAEMRAALRVAIAFLEEIGDFGEKFSSEESRKQVIAEVRGYLMWLSDK